MKLHNKKKRKKIKSTYEKDHPLFAEANKRYCSEQPAGKAVGTAKRKACQSARKEESDQTNKDMGDEQSDEIICMDELENKAKSINDRESIKELIKTDRELIIKAEPNFFITLSMKPCFSGAWSSYDRHFQVAKLYKKAAVLIYKLFVELNPKLKDVNFREWPFFFGTMEHFDKEGNLVAPHLHILGKSDADIETITAIVERLWKKLVEDAGLSGVDIQVVEKKDIWKRASYILKHQHQDGMEELWAGIKPHEVCTKFGWPHDAISHDDWRLNRDTFYSALNGRQNVLTYGNPSRRVDQALYRKFGNLSGTELTEKKQLLWRAGYLEGDEINKLKVSPKGAQLIRGYTWPKTTKE